MYLELFKLTDLPFRLSPDPQFLYLSKAHARAKAYMESTVWFSDGFVGITGEIGSGKTTLIETFIRELSPDILLAQINQTQLSTVEFLQSLLVQFGFTPFRMKKAELLATLESRVQERTQILEAAQAELKEANSGLESQARDLASTNRELQLEMQRREQAEEALRHLQKIEALGQLTGGVAHDFDNLLQVILGSLDTAHRRLMRGEPITAENGWEQVQPAIRSAERAAALTQQLLAFARRQPLSPQTLDINRLVSGMSELLRRTLDETIKIETVLAGGLWPVFADSSQLESAIINLAVNARDAMPDGGRLTIETANTYLDEAYAAAHEEVVAGQYVLLAITDDGAGMTREVLRQAFDPFFTTKEVGQGTGLGLSQVYGFIKQSGGHIKVYSEPVRGRRSRCTCRGWCRLRPR